MAITFDAWPPRDRPIAAIHLTIVPLRPVERDFRCSAAILESAILQPAGLSGLSKHDRPAAG